LIASTHSIPAAGGRPSHRAPVGACDCHFHVFDARFPAFAGAALKSADALVPDYLRLRDRLGIARGVIVTPSTYGTDNACTLDAMAKLGETVRGVAVVDSSVSQAELHRLGRLGIRGFRVNLLRPGTATLDMIEPLARRVADLGWHVQLQIAADDIVRHAPALSRLPVPLVFDHMGRIPLPQGMRHPAFDIIRGLLDAGNAWMKISGFYLESRVGPPSYDDLAQLARTFIGTAPERVVWGSDWPHPSVGAVNAVDDARLFDIAAEWAGTEATWVKMMTHNPEALYDFPKDSRLSPREPLRGSSE
jgi:predicted TIM-barrel fold metal-dependent hydrolase